MYAACCFEHALSLEEATAHQERHIRGVLGQLYRRDKDFDLATVHHEAELKLAREAQDPKLVYDAHAALGLTSYRHGVCELEKVQATEFALQQRDEDDGVWGTIPTTLKDEYMAANAILRQSMTWYESCAALASSFGDAKLEAQAHHRISVVALVLEDFKLSLQAARTHHRIMSTLGDRRGKAQACALLADRLAAHGNGLRSDFDAAVELLWNQSAIAEELGDKKLQADAYYHLGGLFRNAGAFANYFGFKRAKQYYGRAIELLQEVPKAQRGANATKQLDEARRRLKVMQSGDCASQLS